MQLSLSSDTHNNPLALAVVIPAKNEAANLHVSLPALQRALAHFPYPVRLLLVDDGSSDQTVEVARSYGLEIIPGEARGPGAARNLGARHAAAWLAGQTAPGQGWLLFLDADCQVTPDHFQAMMPYLAFSRYQLLAVQERPNLRHWIQKTGSSCKRHLHLWLSQRYGIPVVHAGCLYVRSSEFMALKGFNPDQLCEDIELGLRVGIRHLRLIHQPIVHEISDRRLQRLGTFATLGVPARCTAMLFLLHHVSPGPVVDWLLQQFARLGPARVPISLWWHDPQQLLKVTWGAAFRLGWLWILLLICLETGRIHAPHARIRARKQRQTGNLSVSREVAGQLSGLEP